MVLATGEVWNRISFSKAVRQDTLWPSQRVDFSVCVQASKAYQLIMQGADPVRGGHTRFTWAFPDGDTQVITIESSDDGESWTTGMEAEYRRVR